jgi:hypothetical protein
MFHVRFSTDIGVRLKFRNGFQSKKIVIFMKVRVHKYGSSSD